MRALFDFTVVPVEDSKPGVPAQERLYTVHCAQVCASADVHSESLEGKVALLLSRACPQSQTS
eukprot:38990-Eustigmatos_ZCMA.PRE.1